MKIIKFAFLFVLSLFLNTYENSALAQGTQVPLNPKVITGQLDNGLKYYVLPNAKPENKVELRLVVNAGSILETDQQQGLAHFVEHMAFNGTKNFKKNELVDYLQSVGVKFGAHLNAYTSFDETVYMLSLPSDNSEIVDKGFQILSDWAGGVSFDGDEIDKERGVVLEEYRLRLGADNRMMEQYLPNLLFNSQYAKRLPIGKKDVLENFEHKEVTSYYNDWYRPNLMAVIVVGDMDEKKAVELIKKNFAGLTNPENEKERTVFQVSPHQDLKMDIIQDHEATRSEIQIIIKKDVEEGSGTIADYQKGYERRIFSAMLNARLRELGNEPDAPFSYCWANLGQIFSRTSQGFSMSAIAREGHTREAYKRMVHEIERVRRNGFGENEMRRVLKDLKASLEAAVREESTTDSRRYLRGLQNHFLKGDAFPGASWKLNYFNEFSDRISIEAINNMASEWLGNEGAVIIMTGPENEEFPDYGFVSDTWLNSSAMSVEVYVDHALPESLIEGVPQVGEIVRVETRKDVGITEMVLSNGAKVLYKKTDFKADQLLFHAISKGGLSLVSDAEYQRIVHGMSVINSSGVGTFSENDLEKILSGKRVYVSPYVSSISEGFSGAASPKDMEELFQLTHLYFTQQRVDEAAWEAHKNKSLSITKNMMSNPSSYYRAMWREFISDKHLRGYKIPTEDDWAQSDYALITQIAKARFSGAGDFTFIFVGNFDEDLLQQMVKKYLCPLPAGSTENFKDVGPHPKKGKEKLVVKKGQEPKSMVNIYFSGEAEFSAQEALYLRSLGEVLKIKLTETLREEMSGVYGSSAYGGMVEYPFGKYYFGISFPCGPENVEALKKRALEELNKLIEHGPTLKDLDKVKEAQLRDLQVNMKSNRYWLNHIKDASFYSSVSVEDILKEEDDINAMTPELLKNVAVKYLKGDYLVGVLFPETE